MSYVYNRKPNAEIKDGFYTVVLMDIDSEPKKSEYGFRFDYEVSCAEVPFAIKKVVFLEEDGSDSWKLDKIVKAFNIEPEGITTNGDEESVEINFTKGIGSKALAFLHKDEFINLWDVLPEDASEERKSNLWNAFLKSQSKKAAKAAVSEIPVEGKDTSERPF